MKKKKVLAGILGAVMVAGVATSFAYFTGTNNEMCIRDRRYTCNLRNSAGIPSISIHYLPLPIHFALLYSQSVPSALYPETHHYLTRTDTNMRFNYNN